ncbi:MAG: hypothetical protein HOO91_20040 [Bacteroidales bacterium]|nr:hypothetical protein [Bacteroidales bacterium]
MIKIEGISLVRLRHNEHHQYMSDFNALITKHSAAELGIDSEVLEFNTSIGVQETAMRMEMGSSKSKSIEQQDLVRDKTWNAINLKVKATILSPFADEVASAEVIMRIIDNFGDIRNLSYNAESTAMTNLLTTLMQRPNANHLQKVGITSWVAEMKKQNDEFQAAFNERNTEYAGRDNGDVRITRKAIDPIYNRIVDKINASVVLGVAKPTVATFVGEVNEMINYYKTTIAARNGRSKDKENDEKHSTSDAVTIS